MDQDATWYGGRPRPMRHCVRWGPSPPSKKDTAPNIRPGLSWPNGCIYDQYTTCYGSIGLSLRQIVLDGDPVIKGYSPPPLSAHIRCGQTAGWTKMPFGTEIALGPCNFVLDGDPAPRRKKVTAPNFRPMSIVAKRRDG